MTLPPEKLDAQMVEERSDDTPGRFAMRAHGLPARDHPSYAPIVALTVAKKMKNPARGTGTQSTLLVFAIAATMVRCLIGLVNTATQATLRGKMADTLLKVRLRESRICIQLFGLI